MKARMILTTLVSVLAVIVAAILLLPHEQPRRDAAEEGERHMVIESKTKEIPKQERGRGSKTGRGNHLAGESSPYLLQHADNPVDWYPWGEEAFEKAKREDKPIFLSIGYSTCHWCHVMERETFEDEEAAKALNDTFVCIKVDREERPDIDQIYMNVSHMMTGGGGWPLTIIVTPDKKPFFAATYIPKESRMGRIGVLDLSQRIRELWTERRDEVVESADKITAVLKNQPGDVPGEVDRDALMNQAYEELSARFDSQFGGFGNAPKFPTPHNLFFLLRYAQRTGRKEALTMVQETLRNMRLGGVYDHVGFGFHRYSTDREWLVPHFEKMLYDQALIAMACIETYQVTGNPEYARTAREIFTYVLRDMTSPDGGFYSAEDADSEGVEGKFYVWTMDEIRTVLGPKDAELAARVFLLKPEGNYRDEATGKVTGANILHMDKPLAKTAVELSMTEEALADSVERIRRALLSRREGRVRPLRDDKILTDWNGLMIAALAMGARAMGRPEYSEAAAKAADHVLTRMRSPDGRLLHRYRKGNAGIAGTADDYAFFVWGLLELYETDFDLRYLKTAVDLNSDFIKYFLDADRGGFFLTPSDGEKLLVRPKEIYDGAVPSGNSVAMLNLLRLARLTGNTALEKHAARIPEAFASKLKQFASGYTQLMCGLDFAAGPSYEVVIAGDPGSIDCKEMLNALARPFLPRTVVIVHPPGRAGDEVAKVAEYVKNQKSLDGKATAYVCRNFSCELPTTDPKRMLELLGVPARPTDGTGVPGAR